MRWKGFTSQWEKDIQSSMIERTLNHLQPVRRKNFSLLPYVMFFFAALPLEPYLGSLFIRPVYLVGALAYLLMLLSPRWHLPRAHVSYYITTLILAVYLLINGFINHNLIASVKEVIEVVITVGIFWFIAQALHAVGMESFLRAGGRIFFFFSLVYMAGKFTEGDFLSFKDSYWVILFSCIFATIEVRHVRTSESRLRLALSIIMLIMSGSRTGWVAYLLFSMVIWGVSLRLLLLVGLGGVLLTVIAEYNAQTVAYAATVQLLVQAFGDLSFNELDGWLAVASSFENPSDKFRLTEIVRAILIFQANPLFGVGIDQYINYGMNKLDEDIDTESVIGAHNELLRVLCEGGLFYLTIIAAYYAIAIRQAMRVPLTLKGTCLGLLAASLGMFLFTATNYMITLLLQLSLCLSTGYLLHQRKLFHSSSPAPII
jgi:O-antigen ligase